MQTMIEYGILSNETLIDEEGEGRTLEAVLDTLETKYIVS